MMPEIMPCARSWQIIACGSGTWTSSKWSLGSCSPAAWATATSTALWVRSCMFMGLLQSHACGRILPGCMALESHPHASWCQDDEQYEFCTMRWAVCCPCFRGGMSWPACVVASVGCKQRKEAEAAAADGPHPVLLKVKVQQKHALLSCGRVSPGEEEDQSTPP